MSPARRVAAIMQPTYLPYLGYFHLIAASDVFVFLDDVQFARRSWQSRNRILGAGGEVMLTVPVQKHDRDTPICEIEISEAEPWRDKHLASIRHAYAKRPAFAEGMAFLEATLATRGRLADLNRAIVEGAARKLGLTTEFVNAGDLACRGHRSDHLLAICQTVGATDYLSPMGSHDYMEDDGVFAAADFPVAFQGFVEVPYPQGREPFTPYMAFVDALMNLGWSGLRGLIEQMAARA
ncbi:WbqC family protein [Phenylobacterium sp.]|uniref:WbqC family protein n=1 Tax=Phenylobacterium sp. TaxID=1871053 RepID=UPI002734EE26|nr:WbqC family protein [Phenylobacterium sp.]MDP3853589.1 WbqC family protein [Phenylobacterium sp.]